MPASALSPQVDFVRDEITALKPRYDLVRDCVAGQEKIKERKTVYLPQPNAEDESEENQTRYKQYVERAVFYGVTGRTLNGLVGQIFQKDPVAVIPPRLELMREDADGGGVSLDQQAKKALSQVLQFGRCGVLVDYPRTNAPATVADVEAGKIRPNIIVWNPWDVINWRVATIGGQKLLTLVVISERWVTDDDGFNAETDDQFRVLRLKDGVYVVEIWRESEDKTVGFEIVEAFVPTDAAGQPWKFIPFGFIGAENNDPTPDLPPLYDLATLNVAHYRNSADYEEASYMLGQPTPYVAGLTKDWVDEVFKGRLALGSRAVIPLPVGGTAGLLQVQPNTMPAEAMRHKEEQMKALGAKLIEPGSSQKTATEAGFDEASETSILSTAAKNVSTAFTNALKWSGLFIGADGEISYELNTDFERALATAQDRAQLVAEWQANAISWTELRDGLKSAGAAFQEDEEAKAEIDAAGPDLGSPVKAAEAEAAAQAAAAKAKAAVAAKNTPPAV